MIGDLGSTADYLQFYANHDPGAVALIARGREFTYGQFHRDLRKVTRGAARFGFSAGSSVAVATDDAYTHWLLLLAFENLGIVTGSFHRGEREASSPLLAYVDGVVCDHDIEVPAGKRLFKISDAWLNEILFSPDDDGDGDRKHMVGIGFDRPMHIVRSSGTTGGVKMMIKTRRMYEIRLQNVLSNQGATLGARHLLLFPVSINLVYVRGMGCLRAGATVVLDDTIEPAEAIVRYEPTHVHMLPLHLAKILDDLPKDFGRSRRICVRIGGGVVARSLQERALREIASEIVCWYGANEVDLTAQMDGDGVGSVAPGVELEVVDDDGNPLPPGEVGRIRARSPSIVDGYLDNPEATARSFRNGWFYTGDAGVIEGPRRVRVIGRHDEVLNIGGLKIAPEDIEDSLMTGGLLDTVAIREFAVTSAANPSGIDEICIAVVGDDMVDLDRIAGHVKACLPFYRGEVRTRMFDALPRTQSGKIRRVELRRSFADG